LFDRLETLFELGIHTAGAVGGECESRGEKKSFGKIEKSTMTESDVVKMVRS
jgi:hypothetical protein